MGWGWKMFGNKTYRYSCVVFTSLLLILVPPLMAQTAATGALAGTVTDSTGAVVPNVTVTRASGL